MSTRDKTTVISVIAIFAFFNIVSGDLPENNREWTKTGQHAYSFNGIHFLMYVPETYTLSTEEFPLILNLHGAGQKGTKIEDLEALKFCGLPKHCETDPEFPYIVISPQLPGTPGFEFPASLDRATWYSDMFLSIMNKLLDHLIERYSVDKSRIYLVGSSMGGYGVWAMAMKYPRRFAAIAPLCGEGDPEKACLLKHIPVFVFHAQGDEIMPSSNSDQMVDALRKCNGTVEYDNPPGGSHETCWGDEPYFDYLFYEWLPAQQKKHSWRGIGSMKRKCLK